MSFETLSDLEIVRDRLREVCPPVHIADMVSEDVEKAVNVAFQIIGYHPIDLTEAMKSAYEKSSAETYLCDFIFDVWGCDNGV